MVKLTFLSHLFLSSDALLLRDKLQHGSSNIHVCRLGSVKEIKKKKKTCISVPTVLREQCAKCRAFISLRGNPLFVSLIYRSIIFVCFFQGCNTNKPRALSKTSNIVHHISWFVIKMYILTQLHQK